MVMKYLDYILTNTPSTFWTIKLINISAPKKKKKKCKWFTSCQFR